MKALQDEALTSRGEFVILGNTEVLKQAAAAVDFDPASLVAVESIDQARTVTDGFPVLECDVKQNANFRWGESNAINGANTIAQLKTAVDLAAADQIDGFVFAPLNKEAMHKAGFTLPDEIAFLGELTDTKVRPVVTWKGLYRSSVTGHIPLRAVPDMMTQDRIVPVIQNLWNTMTDLGIEQRRIGVAGLNPHAGEDGAFGDEEIEVISPAIEVARAAGIDITGPHPADTIFVRAMRGEFNGIVFMYHDQGNAPMKTAAAGEGVVMYTGLPFPCASPGHGSAYDIAGQGKADPGGLLNALGIVLDVCANKG